MQLRSGKTTAKMTSQIKITLEVQDQASIHYKSFQSIFGLLRENFTKIALLDRNSLEKVKIFRTIFQLVQSKMVEFSYLKEQPQYANIKKMYLIIKDKISELIRSITNIIITRVELDDEKLEEITSCLILFMKLRKQFK